MTWSSLDVGGTHDMTWSSLDVGGTHDMVIVGRRWYS